MRILLLLAFVIFFNVAFSQELKFESPDFEKIVLAKYPEIDINNNHKIEKKEAALLKKLDLMEQNLTTAKDVNFFKNLEYLSLTINQLRELKLNDFKQLQELYCARNNLTKLEITNMPQLKRLGCGRNELEKVSLVNCPNLESLNLMDNKITALDVSPFKYLKYLSVDANKLKSLDISQNPELIQFAINDNDISQIDITKNQKLRMNILYMDDHVKIIGTSEQIKNYKKAPVVIGN